MRISSGSCLLEMEMAGENAVVHFQENSGHELGYDEISVAKEWLVNVPIR
jgi:hypothetical protein